MPPLGVVEEQDGQVDKVDVNLVKHGDNVIFVELCRSKGGVTVHVRVHPIVEEFMKNLGNGTTKAVDLYGKAWTVEKEQPPLEVYHLGAPPEVDEGKFRLDCPGHPLFDEGGMVNLSYLRVAGVSKGAGVSFTVRMPSGLANLRRLQDKIAENVKYFYRDYIKPVNLAVIVSTQEF